MKRVAVIDTGTNSTRLLIAERSDSGLREIMRQTTITRLGEGVESRGVLSEAAMSRVRECVAGYAASVGELGAGRALVIATSSARDARNGPDFIRSIGKDLAFDYAVLTGLEEASLGFEGAVMDFASGLRTMVFDVGGGSTEIVIGKGREVEFATSTNLGCVRIREKFMPSDPASSEEISPASAFIETELEAAVGGKLPQGIQNSVAVAGTVTTLAAIDLGLDVYDRNMVHGHVLTRAGVGGLFEMLSALSLEERRQIPVIEKGRADIIVAGALIVKKLLERTGVDEFTVSEHDILDGAALAMLDGRL